MSKTLDYPVIGYCETSRDKQVPLLDIPMMSDEEWNIGAKRNAVSNYINHFHRTPPNIATAQEWQDKWIDEMLAGAALKEPDIKFVFPKGLKKAGVINNG